MLILLNLISYVNNQIPDRFDKLLEACRMESLSEQERLEYFKAVLMSRLQEMDADEEKLEAEE